MATRPTPPAVPPLARSVTKDVLDWEEVDPLHVEIAKDVLGLSPMDRQALGLSQPRHTDLQAPSLGGAETALAEVLARGGAVTPGGLRADRAPSTPSGKPPARRKA